MSFLASAGLNGWHCGCACVFLFGKRQIWESVVFPCLTLCFGGRHAPIRNTLGGPRPSLAPHFPSAFLFLFGFFPLSRFFSAGADYQTPQELFALHRDWLPEEAGGGADPSGLFQSAPLLTLLQKTALPAKFLPRPRAALGRGPFIRAPRNLEGCCCCVCGQRRWNWNWSWNWYCSQPSAPSTVCCESACPCGFSGAQLASLLLVRLQTSHCAHEIKAAFVLQFFTGGSIPSPAPVLSPSFCHLSPQKKKKRASASSRANHNSPI